MANPEHVEIVRRGAKAIEDWRATHPGEVLDLRSANLSGVDLSGAGLAQSDLAWADLSRVNLREADLSAASLLGANLSEADLSWADLYDTDLRDAILDHADLEEADLTWANLTWAHLEGANLSCSRINETIVGGGNLSDVEGLESAIHQGPSVLDLATIARSRSLPLSFLRGCGVPERLIEYLPSLLQEAIQFYSCFISYSSRDQGFADRLHADLQDKGVRCWFAPEDLHIGDRFRLRIDEAIRLHDRLLLILSEHSVASTWVEEEVEAALEKERKAKERGEEKTVLFPIRLDDAVMDSSTAWAASIRRTRHIGDFRRWKGHDAYQQAFERLLRDLKA